MTADDRRTLDDVAIQGVTAQHQHEEAEKRRDLALATILTLVGVIVIILLELMMRTGSADFIDHSREGIVSMQANAFIAAFVGICIMILRLLKGRTSGGAVRSESSFFHRMEPSLLSGGTLKSQADSLDQGGGIPIVLRIPLYLISAGIPALGCIAGGILVTNKRTEHRAVGSNCIKISIAALVVLNVMLGIIYLAVSRVP
ncbi:MAG: hypothetical protein JW880_07545 [Candidatus Thermoplasmatota archaeon]|nr:hypothetical protein [Candidatus Thermoplasmatota archaeon]